MSIPPIWIALVALSFIGVVIGTYVNFRSVRAGRGPSPTGIAIQVAAFAVVVLAVCLTIVIAIATSGLWLASILLIPILATLAILVLGAVQGLMARRRP
jgi:hypothetical protein